MAYRHFLVAALLPLAACGGGNGTNPVFNGIDDGTVSDGETLEGTLPGTEDPTSDSRIVRYEAEDGSGNGYAQDIAYDEGSDTFFVNNLAFDGANEYTRSAAPATLSGFGVYEGSGTETDPLTGASIPQFEYRALYARSTNTTADGDPATEFAIVRTGTYVGYGFGGFLFQRNDGVVLPITGQAGYSGQYAALRDFDGRADLEYATGSVILSIDFEDFDAGDAVQGTIYDRAIYDIDGNDITGSVLAALNEKYDPDDEIADYTVLPNLGLVVGPNSINRDGEIVTGASSFVRNADGQDEAYEAGTFYAVVSGDDADEVVGVVTVTGEDPRYENVTARETGGFILYRP